MDSSYTEISINLGPPENVHDFEHRIDTLSNALADLDWVDVGANLRTGRVDICVTLPACNKK